MDEITVILNGYKRPEYLKEQVEAIKGQTIKPKEIWIWCNSEESANVAKSIQGIDVVISSSRNFKYHGRFSLGLLATTKYLAYFDDDTIPGSKWFENCLNTIRKCKNNKVILGGAGVILNSNSYITHTRTGWPAPKDIESIVDLVGHAWFFEKTCLNCMWKEDPPSFDNGEDIHLSFNNWIYEKVITITPPHPINDKEMWSSLKAWEYGNDSKASSNGSLIPIPLFYKQRDDIIAFYINKGYRPAIVRMLD